MKINKELKKYIESNIFPSYSQNDDGHNINHIEYVIRRSLNFASSIKDINYDIVYTIAAYHDIGHHIDKDNHELVSAQLLLADKELKNFFTEEEITIIAEAVEDHRASSKNEPRSIYGKIVSSADRNVLIENTLQRTYSYRLKYSPNFSLEEVIEESRQHILNKFGNHGYAREKIYFEDLEYKQYLKEITELAQNKTKFKVEYIKANNLSTDNKA